MQARQALREREEQFRTLVDSIPNLAWWANGDGHVTWYNRRWYEYTGTTSEQMEGWGWQSAHDPQVLPGVLEKWRSCLATGAVFEMEVPLRGADGKYRWFLTRAIPLRDPAGKVLRWFGTSTDTSVMREARLVLARSNEELESRVAERTAKLQELVEDLEHFSYSITHDMRAPLRAMRCFAESVNDEIVDENQRELLGRIITAAKRMDALIVDALNYSKAVRQELPLVPIDVGKLLRGMLDTYPEFQSSREQIKVEWDIPLVMGNEAGLTQCLSNLLGNAVKFAQEGTSAQVRVWSELRDGWVRLWVEDNGIGIPESMLPRLFDMFSRGAGPQAGTGVGLALVRKVVARMGGRVGVESDLGKGSRFWVELKPAEGQRRTLTRSWSDLFKERRLVC
jgi:PAS domain S-box-containing protein